MNIDKQLLRLFERGIVDSPELINNESFVGAYAELKAQDMGVPIETLVDSDAFSELAQAIVDHNSNGEAGNSETSDCESKELEETEKKAESLELVKQPTYNECRKVITRVFKKLRRKAEVAFGRSKISRVATTVAGMTYVTAARATRL